MSIALWHLPMEDFPWQLWWWRWKSGGGRGVCSAARPEEIAKPFAGFKHHTLCILHFATFLLFATTTKYIAICWFEASHFFTCLYSCQLLKLASFMLVLIKALHCLHFVIQSSIMHWLWIVIQCKINWKHYHFPILIEHSTPQCTLEPLELILNLKRYMVLSHFNPPAFYWCATI